MEGSKLQNPKVGLYQTSQVVFGLQRRILLSRNVRRELAAFKGKSKTISFQYEEIQSKNPGELIRKKLGALPSHLKHLSDSFRFKVDSKVGRRENYPNIVLFTPIATVVSCYLPANPPIRTSLKIDYLFTAKPLTLSMVSVP